MKTQGKRGKDSILCHDKEEAKKIIDLYSSHVLDWEFLEDGKIRLFIDNINSI